MDMMAGSLIKNPGGGLAPVGGYIVGKKECVENAACRLTSPGLAKEVGASLGILNSFYQGFFLAPTVTAGALKGAIFAANIYESCGFPVVPNGSESRHDIIQAVELGTAEGVIAFCRGIQAAAPVDSYVTPEPWAMPGYDSDVIMAAGAFVQGSSIELSADGPIKPPYAVYFQGGLTWQHAKLGILMSLQKLYDADLVRLPLYKEYDDREKTDETNYSRRRRGSRIYECFSCKTAGYRSDRSGGTGKTGEKASGNRKRKMQPDLCIQRTAAFLSGNRAGFYRSCLANI